MKRALLISLLALGCTDPCKVGSPEHTDAKAAANLGYYGLLCSSVVAGETQQALDAGAGLTDDAGGLEEPAVETVSEEAP